MFKESNLHEKSIPVDVDSTILPAVVFSSINYKKRPFKMFDLQNLFFGDWPTDVAQQLAR